MAKSKDVKKEVKKEAAKTPKEKKAEKRNKKPSYEQVFGQELTISHQTLRLLITLIRIKIVVLFQLMLFKFQKIKHI